MMKLVTKQIEKAIQSHPHMSQDGKGGEAQVLLRVFGGACTFYVLEGGHAEGEVWDGHTVYGLVNTGYGFEYGLFNLEDLSLGYPFGRIHLPFERDLYCPKTLAECARTYREEHPWQNFQN